MLYQLLSIIIFSKIFKSFLQNYRDQPIFYPEIPDGPPMASVNLATKAQRHEGSE